MKLQAKLNVHLDNGAHYQKQVMLPFVPTEGLMIQTDAIHFTVKHVIYDVEMEQVFLAGEMSSEYEDTLLETGWRLIKRKA